MRSDSASYGLSDTNINIEKSNILRVHVNNV